MSWETILDEGFEGRFEDWQEIGELTVPEGWTPVWREGTEAGIDHRPECDRERDRPRSGSSAAKMFTVHASHTGALAKRMSVRAGERVRVVAWGATWKDECGHGLRVGIDPDGGLDFEAESVVWSSWWGQYNSDWTPEAYHEFSAVAEPEGDYVTVFLYSHSDYKGSVVAAYWDDVVIEQEGGGGIEPPQTGDLAAAVEVLAAAVEALAAAVEALA